MDAHFRESAQQAMSEGAKKVMAVRERPVRMTWSEDFMSTAASDREGGHEASHAEQFFYSNTTAFVDNLPLTVTSDDIKQAFADCGRILDARGETSAPGCFL